MESFSIMVPAIFVTLSVLLGIAGILFSLRWWRRQRGLIRNIAAELGLSCHDPGEGMEGDSFQEALSGQAASGRALEFMKKLFATFGPWRMEGRWEGVRVEIYPETRSSGKSSSTYLIVRSWYETALSFELRVAREGIFTKLGKALFGLQDVEIGEPEFDAVFRVKSSDPLAAKLLLCRSEVGRSLLAAVRLYPHIRAEQAFIHFERQGYLKTSAEIRAVLDALCPAARAIGG